MGETKLMQDGCVSEINDKQYLFTPDVIKNKWFDFIQYHKSIFTYTQRNLHF